MEQEQTKFEGWAIIELMGHQREAGYVTSEAYGQAVLFGTYILNSRGGN